MKMKLERGVSKKTQSFVLGSNRNFAAVVLEKKEMSDLEICHTYHKFSLLSDGKTVFS